MDKLGTELGGCDKVSACRCPRGLEEVRDTRKVGNSHIWSLHCQLFKIEPGESKSLVILLLIVSRLLDTYLIKQMSELHLGNVQVQVLEVE